MIQEERVWKLVSKYGTPFYGFDADVLSKRVNYLKASLPENVELCYAAKANSFILKLLEKKVTHFEICSPGEFHICKKLQISNRQIVLSGVYKNKEDIEEIFRAKEELPIMTIESFEQYKLIQELADIYQRNVSVLLRLTSGNQFGLDKDVLKEILVRCRSSRLHVLGIQYFSGTQKYSQKRVLKELDLLEELLAELKEMDFEPELLEYGPGFPVDYFSSMKFEENEHLQFFSEAIKRFGNLKIVLELGRSIAASCGFYVTQVVDTKTNRNQNYALVDGGIHHLVYYGQGMAMKQPPFRFLNQKDQPEENWNICGALCTINDILMKQVRLPKPQIGDLFVFENTGAYCPTEGMSLFLTRDLPAVVIVNEKEELMVRDHTSVVSLNAPKLK
ncbi:MAG: alanine racemase [Faecalicoccus sp.]|uniref:diaminopimelate decarboxylase family protein n=1 Tax=Faecalicoccus sp. TaxID=1971758 RepID=UPI002A920EB7|nr:alanine racemase [Faecalicoccus sp.]MDY5232086.1 alanine racemase [Faecalicoccus sp.]